LRLLRPSAISIPLPKGSSPSLAGEHTPEAIRRRLAEGPRVSYLKDFVYGGIDGTVTTFAIVAGVAGAELSSAIVVVLGVANLVGDGFSMAASSFLSARTEGQRLERARRAEELHIERVPDGEREEVRQIYAAKGFAGEDLETVVSVITSDRELWVETMLREELGLSSDPPEPVRTGLATFTAFLFAGFVPLLFFVADVAVPSGVGSPLAWSAALAGATFLAVGIAKSKFVDQHWYWSGIETLTVGAIAAGLAYLIGWALKGLA
jgi:vacuolar iron transporter family protein